VGDAAVAGEPGPNAATATAVAAANVAISRGITGMGTRFAVPHTVLPERP